MDAHGAGVAAGRVAVAGRLGDHEEAEGDRELSVQVDHVHVVVSIPPKVSVSTYMGTIKGKTAIKVYRSYPMLKKRPYWGNHFWARGYFVNTVGINEDMIKRYVKFQEAEERKEENNQQGFDFE